MISFFGDLPMKVHCLQMNWSCNKKQVNVVRTRRGVMVQMVRQKTQDGKVLGSIQGKKSEKYFIFNYIRVSLLITELLQKLL